MQASLKRDNLEEVVRIGERIVLIKRLDAEDNSTVLYDWLSKTVFGCSQPLKTLKSQTVDLSRDLLRTERIEENVSRSHRINRIGGPTRCFSLWLSVLEIEKVLSSVEIIQINF